VLTITCLKTFEDCRCSFKCKIKCYVSE